MVCSCGQPAPSSIRPILTFQPQQTANYRLDEQTHLGLAVNVTPLWDVERLLDYIGNQSALSLPSCERTGSFVRNVTFFCPDFYRRSNRTGVFQSCPRHSQHSVCFLVSDWLREPLILSAPTLLVTIDYDKLNTPRSPFSIDSIAYVALAMDNDTQIVQRTSRFLPAVPGTHILAGVRCNIRRINLGTDVFFGIFPVRLFCVMNRSLG
jgi:hypothetical protein